MAVWLDNWRHIGTAGFGVAAFALIALLLSYSSTTFATEPTEDTGQGDDSRNSAQLTADENLTRETNTPSAEALLLKVYEDEAWLSKVDSFLLRSVRIHSQTDEARKQSEVPAVFGGEESTRTNSIPARHLLLAWDQDRVVMDYRFGDLSRLHCTWDGSLAVSASHRTDKKRESEQVTYEFDNTTNRLFHSAFSERLLWGRAASNLGPNPWWRALDYGQSEMPAVPRMVEFVGREKYGGYDCYRVDIRYSNRLYIRVSDCRLVAEVHVHSKLSRDERQELRSKIAGRAFESATDWIVWCSNLKDEESYRASRSYMKELYKGGQVYHEVFFDDYREVAPSCWFPYRQRTRSSNGRDEKSVPAVLSETKILELEVNTEIPSELFQYELAEGTKVTTDYRYDPWIRYTYRKSQTEADRQKLSGDKKIFLDEREQDWEAIRLTIDVKLGQEPPELPQNNWIGSDPQTWEELRGKLVVLGFWDVEHGPSQFSLDKLKLLHDYDWPVIAVHRATEDTMKVEEYVADQGWSFPVVIDGNGKEQSEASLFEWFLIQRVPWMTVIDRDGKFISHDYNGVGRNVFTKFSEFY